MSEQELIQLLQSGDESAFRELVDRFQHNVYNTALGYVQNGADAEDIAQEVFIQVYRSITQIKGGAALSTWMYRITVNKSLDFIQNKKRKKRFGFITALWDDQNRPIHEAVNFDHPGVLYDNKQDAALLFNAIRQLPENQQTAFVLNKIELLSYKEIASVMQVSESAVDSLLSRAKENLRKRLKNIS